jgi:hypothetical protein
LAGALLASNTSSFAALGLPEPPSGKPCGLVD